MKMPWMVIWDMVDGKKKRENILFQKFFYIGYLFIMSFLFCFDRIDMHDLMLGFFCFVL
jgi:hypothetical protein